MLGVPIKNPEAPLLFNACSVCHSCGKIFQINGLLVKLIDVTADHDIVNAAQGNIDRTAVDQPTIIGINDSFDDFMFKVTFLANIWPYFKCT